MAVIVFKTFCCKNVSNCAGYDESVSDIIKWQITIKK